MRIFILIPAWREEKTIASVLGNIYQNGYSNVVVIDDGSEDKTAEIAEKSGALVLRHAINRGQGAALITGTQCALEHQADIIVHFDADGQFDASEIQEVILPIMQGKADIVFGSRFLKKKSNVPLVRRWTLKLAVWFHWFLFGIKLSDAHNGFRALTRKAAEALSLAQDRSAHATEIISEAKKQHLRFQEVPVTISYSSYSLKKGQNILSSFKILWDLLKGKILIC